MRQFRMPLRQTKNLRKFKRQLGSLLKNLKNFCENEKYEAFSYLQGCISAERIGRRKLKTVTKVKARSKKHIFKCVECTFKDTTRKGMYKHLKSHSGFAFSCKSCKNTYTNSALFQWHLKYHCKSATHICTECPRKFTSKQNLRRHMEGHKRNNCTYCDQVITNRKNLICHLYNVHSIKLEQATFKCSLCDKRYVKQRSLNYHKQQHYKDKLVCLDCGIIFEDYDEISKHQKDHENQKHFKCTKCDQKFCRRQQYLLHMEKHDNYKCLTCKESFASKMKMLVHKRNGHIVEGLRPKFSCPDCEKEFFQRSKLMLHLRKHSEDKPSLHCQYCDITFQSPYAYYKHSITVSHEKSSPETSVYVCESCGSQFPKKYLLDQHNARIHDNNKEFVICEFCPYKTKNKTNMKRHREIHICNGKTFICERCGKNFNNSASLKGHISYIHLQNKQFKCSECDKAFKRNSELVRHQATHSDDRPHVCTHCGQSYKRLTHLRRHEKSSHNQSEATPKRLVDSNSTLISVEEAKKEQTSLEDICIPVSMESSLNSEPLALVKRKDNHSNEILTADPIQEINYFSNIPTNNGNSNPQSNSLKTDSTMSLMSKSIETNNCLNTQYADELLIEDYIEYGNIQLIESHPGNYSIALSFNK